jgi:hypothetical protein
LDIWKIGGFPSIYPPTLSRVADHHRYVSRLRFQTPCLRPKFWLRLCARQIQGLGNHCTP